jgi:GGDEF domain-containing protein
MASTPPKGSHFVDRLDVLISQWEMVLPEELRQRFRESFRSFGQEHDEALNVIENVWKRRERDYAFDESGLARRRPFQDHLVSLLRTPPTPARAAVGLLFVDVDHLKSINDTYGHAMGDKAVSAVGGILKDALRADRDVDLVDRAGSPDELQDPTLDVSVSRHGGDEFLAALELKTVDDISLVASRIKRRVDDPGAQRALGYTAPVKLTAAVGGVVYPLTLAPPPLMAGMLARKLVMAADEQMYAAKRDGRVHIAVAALNDRLDLDPEHTQFLVL